MYSQLKKDILVWIESIFQDKAQDYSFYLEITADKKQSFFVVRSLTFKRKLAFEIVQNSSFIPISCLNLKPLINCPDCQHKLLEQTVLGELCYYCQSNRCTLKHSKLR